jgi:hypothetical protein
MLVPMKTARAIPSWSAAHVGHDHPPARGGEIGGDVLEILGVTGQAVQADHRRPGGAGTAGVVARIEFQPVGRRPFAIAET